MSSHVNLKLLVALELTKVDQDK